jgi:hypothetical protein
LIIEHEAMIAMCATLVKSMETAVRIFLSGKVLGMHYFHINIVDMMANPDVRIQR